VLSPAPSQAVTVAQGATVTFTFTSSAPGAYSVYLGRSVSAGPARFPSEPSRSLLLQSAFSDTLTTVTFEALGTGGPKTGLVGK